MIWGGRGEAGSFVGVSGENFLVFVCGGGGGLTVDRPVVARCADGEGR